MMKGGSEGELRQGDFRSHEEAQPGNGPPGPIMASVSLSPTAAHFALGCRGH